MKRISTLKINFGHFKAFFLVYCFTFTLIFISIYFTLPNAPILPTTNCIIIGLYQCVDVFHHVSLTEKQSLSLVNSPNVCFHERELNFLETAIRKSFTKLINFNACIVSLAIGGLFEWNNGIQPTLWLKLWGIYKKRFIHFSENRSIISDYESEC